MMLGVAGVTLVATRTLLTEYGVFDSLTLDGRTNFFGLQECFKLERFVMSGSSFYLRLGIYNFSNC